MIDHFDPTKQIAIIWSVEDVQAVANVTDDEAMEILNRVKDKHDANEGISWDTLKITADLMGYDLKDKE